MNYLRGNPIILNNGNWVYSDTMEPTIGNLRECGQCKKPKTKEGHDWCLGELPNIMNACCGHGIESDAYIQFWDSSRVGGKNALSKIKEFRNTI